MSPNGSWLMGPIKPPFGFLVFRSVRWSTSRPNPRDGCVLPKNRGRGVTVAVTGASGYVGSRLIRTLCADAEVERVLGFDLRPPGFSHAKFVFDDFDVRKPEIEHRFKGVDVVVHLAFIMDPVRDQSLMRD